MKTMNKLKTIAFIVAIIFTCSCSNNNSNSINEVSIESANFESFTNRIANLNRAIYDFKNTPKIQVEGYNKEYTYQLKLKGRYLGKEYILSLNNDEVSNGNINKKEAVGTTVAPVKEVEETRVSLDADLDELNLDVDDYIATIIEVESGTELSIASADELTATEIDYKTFVIDSNATNFLSGTQIESDNWTILSELNLNDFSYFRVRPSVVSYINGIAIVLGVYDLDLNKIGYITSNGSNGNSSGAYSYKFNSSKLNDLITKDGEYLLRFEERTSTIDANDTGYRNAIFQKINITKLSGQIINDDI